MEKYYRATLIESWRAPKKVGGNIEYKSFPKGTKVEVAKYNRASTPLNYVPIYKTRDGFGIPEAHLHILGAIKSDIPKANVVKDSDMVSSETMNKAKKKASAHRKESMVAGQKTRSKAMVNGALIGGGIALIYAMYKGKENKAMIAAFGVIAGGIGGKFYSNMKKGK